MRYAIYFTPPAGEPLTRAATSWLGRNIFNGHPVGHPPIDGMSAAEIAFHTAAPRRYGFHATLKAPFELAEGKTEADLLRALMLFCTDMDPVALGRLSLRRIGPFFALTPEAPVAGLGGLADAVVRAFDPFRAPLDEADIARRNPEKLRPAEFANLMRWGYPYVFGEFRFHMTLTGPVEEAEAGRIERVLHDFFDPVLSEPVEIGNLALFIEPERGAPFMVHSLHPLGRVATRKIA